IDEVTDVLNRGHDFRTGIDRSNFPLTLLFRKVVKSGQVFFMGIGGHQQALYLASDKEIARIIGNDGAGGDIAFQDDAVLRGRTSTRGQAFCFSRVSSSRLPPFWPSRLASSRTASMSFSGIRQVFKVLSARSMALSSARTLRRAVRY